MLRSGTASPQRCSLLLRACSVPGRTLLKSPPLFPSCTYTEKLSRSYSIDASAYPPSKIRNFAIVAHIDHGKSTLADRLLQLTGTIPTSEKPQFLDKLAVERQRGITVKAQTVTIFYNGYMLNLIDTPGHVDFSYEVSRSMACCDGAILLVDSTQGIQAQTIANFYHAFGEGLQILPVLNKVDLDSARPQHVAEEIKRVFEIDQPPLQISAKTGLGVNAIFPYILEKIPSPRESSKAAPLRALLFDSYYDAYRGVVVLINVKEGAMRKGDMVMLAASQKKYEVVDIGVMNPEEKPTGALLQGQVGYAVLNIKDISEAKIGDTIHGADHRVVALPGFAEPKSMVFAGIFPTSASDFDKLRISIARLSLSDRSVNVQRETSTNLGQGFRLGFLGTLHLDVFKQRLQEEYDAEIIQTSPNVPYRLVTFDGRFKEVTKPSDVPDTFGRVYTEIQEPMIIATLIFPVEHMGAVIKLCGSRRAVQRETNFLDQSTRVLMQFDMPLAESITDFFGALKSATSGFASFDYEHNGYAAADIVKVNIHLCNEPVEALSFMVHRSQAQIQGRIVAAKLKEVIRRHQFEVVIQAMLGSKSIAKESIAPMRKDVLARLYGGDVTRKNKLLDAQREGKKRLKAVGRVQLDQEAFLAVLKK